ncbi:MAG: O-antigen ligase family protein [Candidatus Moranbacteria bacterium]|nr:O-antigen ligase family protein [Candidatus Moranbacteria bacterium]
MFIFLIWSAISIFWASFWIIAVYRLLIILLIVNFAVIIRNLAKKGDIKAEFIYISLLLGGIFQSLLGIFQFLLNRSLGFRILGESIIGPDLPGIAKIVVFGAKHIRAYGTFPHPNVLAGFLIIQIIFLFSLITKRLAQNASTKDKVPHETILTRIPTCLLLVALFLNTACFLLTFSRSAFLSLFLIGLALLLAKLAAKRKLIWLIMAITIFLLLLHGILDASRHSKIFFLSTQSLEERNSYLEVSRETIVEHPWLGLGIGQFIVQEIVSRPNWSGWQYQPVHNVYLLITAELGIVGLILFLMFLLTFINNYCKINRLPSLLTTKPYCIIIFSFLFISFFDHYFWDIKSGMIIFAIPLILDIVDRAYIRKISG